MEADYNRELLKEREYKVAERVRVGIGTIRRWRLDKLGPAYIEGLLRAGPLSSGDLAAYLEGCLTCARLALQLSHPRPNTSRCRQPAQIAASVAKSGLINRILVATNAGIIAGHKRGHRAP